MTTICGEAAIARMANTRGEKMEQLTCPDCGSGLLREEVKEQEFQLGSRKPVTLKATYPVFICNLCGAGTFDWRGEMARALAMSAYSKSQNVVADIPEPWRSAHALGSQHRKQLEHIGRCGCFYCLAFFDAGDVVEWIDDNQTALCPRCGIDSVLPVTEEITPEFLKQMQQYWFAAVKEL
jgi:predicted RNA-binding Zn-ribbon protein involved in translation (DUF1610 family)